MSSAPHGRSSLEAPGHVTSPLPMQLNEQGRTLNPERLLTTINTIATVSIGSPFGTVDILIVGRLI